MPNSGRGDNRAERTPVKVKQAPFAKTSPERKTTPNRNMTKPSYMNPIKQSNATRNSGNALKNSKVGLSSSPSVDMKYGRHKKTLSKTPILEENTDNNYSSVPSSTLKKPSQVNYAKISSEQLAFRTF